jgi:integrase
VARDAGIGKRLTPHGLRHSAITIGLDAGVSLRDMQDFARHVDPKTTRRYDRARQALNRHATYAIAHYLAGGT